MGLEFLLPFVISYLILWIGFYVFQRTNFNSKLKYNFSLRNTFTFETHNFKSETNKYLRIWYVAASILSIVPFVVFFAINGIRYTIDVHILTASVLLALSVVLKIFLFFTKTVNIKLFIFEYVGRFLTFVGSILFLVIGIMTTISEGFNLYLNNTVVMWIFFVLFIILLLLNTSCLFNSKFYNWFNYEKSESGEIKKPNTILTALYQWVFDYSEVIFVVFATIFVYFL